MYMIEQAPLKEIELSRPYIIINVEGHHMY